MSIVVTTPTGNIGHVVVEKLLAAGEEVGVIVRDPAKLQPSVRERVTIHQGSLEDSDFVVRATQGAEALFYLTPPNFVTPDWKALYEAAAKVASAAVTSNRIPYVVHLSSGGADRATGFGPVSYLQIVENALNATGANVLHLRPGFFYENFLMQVEPIAHQGAIYYPFSAETTYPLIATRDIGVVAAERLRDRSWTGQHYLGLHGPEPVPSFGQAAAILGEAIGRPVQFVTIPVEQMESQLAAMGASPSVIKEYGELMSAMGRGEQPAEPRTQETTTPTTLADWAREVLRPAVEAAAAAAGQGKA